ncbi:hypothetical protein DPEC_G00063010 [Dallia pectoralis]|uniref:Uncharacterized protein n=1 Tax=Dallia pectoralis TaxID=75939 RepID=A0ACC2H7B7_DALPE|nr:hypothetical protein DPEC_G00063010 [Dallia pectoralis]
MCPGRTLESIQVCCRGSTILPGRRYALARKPEFSFAVIHHLGLKWSTYEGPRMPPSTPSLPAQAYGRSPDCPSSPIPPPLSPPGASTPYTDPHCPRS